MTPISPYNASDVYTVSFVDVMANGMACMMLLLILMVAMQKHIEFTDSETASDNPETKKREDDRSGDSTGTKNTFIVVVIGRSGQTIFNDGSGRWREPQPQQQCEVHRTFAVMHADITPDGPLVLEGLNNVGSSPDVHVFVDGKVVPARPLQINAEGTATVWDPNRINKP